MIKCGWCLDGFHDRCKPWLSDGTRSCTCAVGDACGESAGAYIPPGVLEVREEPRRYAPGGFLCRCGCGDRTRGGVFLPGHDSKYLSRLSREYTEDAGDALDAALSVSVAFFEKFCARVGHEG